MSDRLTIRAVVPEDFPQWLPLWQGYNAFYGRVDATALPEEITQRTWSRFFDAYEPMGAVVAQQDGELVGLAHYLFHRLTNWIAPACYLEDLFTAEQARGQGVGKALITAVRERGSEAGAAYVYWHTHETNATARRLYDQVAKRSGFIVYRADV